MTLVIEESEDISTDLLAPLLATLRRNNKVNILCVFYQLSSHMFYELLTKIHLTGCYTDCKDIG